MYNQQDNINKSTLINNEQFVDDAADFLIDREGYEAEDLDTAEKVYDAYMEHFRFQNVNESTAVMDMMYAQNTDAQGKARMARLMDAYDKMDSDLGLAALGDYAAGVFSAPSTYAGIFTGGGAKVGALAAQQGIKLGIRQLLKGGAAGQALRQAATKGAVRAGAVEATIGAGQVAAQEQARVESGMQEDIRGGAVAIGAAAAALPGSIFGAGSQVQRAVAENTAERVMRITEKQAARATNHANRTTTREVFEDDTTSETANEIFSELKQRKAALSKTVPSELERGKELKRELAPEDAEIIDAPLDPKPKLPLEASVENKNLQNIAAVAAKIVHQVPDLPPGILKEGEVETFTSKLVRALRGGQMNTDSVVALTQQHGVRFEDIGALLATEVSNGGSLLGKMSALSRESKKKLALELDEIDKLLIEAGQITNPARDALDQLDDQLGRSGIEKAKKVMGDINKARIGFMTIQLATTSRNMSNGYMRNFFYAFDNLGSGLYNKYFASDSAKRRLAMAGKINPTEEEIIQETKRSVNLGKAQLRTSYDAFLFKDLMTITTQDTTALARLMQDPRFGKSELAKQIFMDMGDVADHMKVDSGIMRTARFLNKLNTKSDNMFKRAILARELDKSLRASSGKVLEIDGKPVTFANLEAFENFIKTDAGQAFKDVKFSELADTGTLSLNEVLKKGRFTDLDDKLIGQAMEKALDFTYQTGRFKGKEGAFNSAAAFFIDAAQTQLGSTFVPFPRYLVNQFRFVYEHAPIFGMIDAWGILNKSDFGDRIGKQLGGTAMLTALYALRANHGDETTGPFEYNNPFGSGIVDAQASLGPFSAYAFAADLAYRTLNPDKVARPAKIRDFIKSLGGGQFRPTGLGLVDGLFDTLQKGVDDGETDLVLSEIASKYMGNYFNTYTVGAGVLKDIVATLDPEMRVVADNTDVEFWPYMFKQATRSFPREITGEESYFLGRDALKSPTRSEPIRIMNPFMRQITGLTQQEERNMAEREFDKLGLEYTQITPRKIKGDPELTADARGIMGKFVETGIQDYIINDPEYNGLTTSIEKKSALRARVNELRSEARSRVLNVKQYTDIEDQRRVARAVYFNIPSSKRDLIALYYNRVTGKNLGDTKDYLTAVAVAEEYNITGGN
jgi:hypothetical protein|tara:strand:+ start:3870 stop:7286 length:3417 start_codon:yes stop_codon:yes gene_type:complete